MTVRMHISISCGGCAEELDWNDGYECTHCHLSFGEQLDDDRPGLAWECSCSATRYDFGAWTTMGPHTADCDTVVLCQIKWHEHEGDRNALES